MESILIGRYRVNITNPQRILFPKSGITKKQLINYYSTIAPYMLPYVKDKPMSLQRFPEGITHTGFYQKNAADYFPAWIKTAQFRKRDGDGIVSYVLCQNRATLVYLANQAAIEMHLWLSKADAKYDYPDRMIFDLDPSGASFEPVRKAAYLIKEVLDAMELVSYIMTTGSRGLHVVVPIKRTLTYEQVRSIAFALADKTVAKAPDLLTRELLKAKRKGRVFIDALRNSYSATAIAPFSVRAREGAPIATPIFWHELEDPQLTSQKYTIANISRYLEKSDDPWKDMRQNTQSLKKLLALVK